MDFFVEKKYHTKTIVNFGILCVFEKNNGQTWKFVSLEEIWGNSFFPTNIFWKRYGLNQRGWGLNSTKEI